MKTIEEINEKIKKGKAVVFNAEEIIEVARKKGISRTAREVDVVTTGTFGPMCSSGAYFNIGHTQPRIKIGGGSAYLNGVPAYTGFAAVDIYIGATALPEHDPRNWDKPGEFKYGGGHVIEDLVSGEEINLEANAYGTDCYPRKHLETKIKLDGLNEAVLFNPRNAYQNYNVAVNLSDHTIYTYMGVLKARLGNANYCSAGQLSPLLNDPLYKTIGIGTRIFLGGGTGYVVWNGTQHNPSVPRLENATPKKPAGTLAVIGDLKHMKPDWLRGTSMLGYGTSLSVGIGIPIPILSEEILQYTLVTDDELLASIVDYSQAYPQRKTDILGEISYGQLRSGTINLDGKSVPTASLSSYFKALEISEILKDWINRGNFLLAEPVQSLPSDGIKMKNLELKI